MKKLIINIIVLSVSFLTGCCPKFSPTSIIEIKNTSDTLVKIDNHETGKFLIGINPIKYSKTKFKIKLKGVISYPDMDLYTTNYDTLLRGIDNVELLICKLSPKTNILIPIKNCKKADCNGVFDVKFKRKANNYLVFKSSKTNTTGFNTKYYFKDFSKKYNSELFIKKNCK